MGEELDVDIIERKDVRGDDPIEYFFHKGSEVLFVSQKSY